MIGGFPSQTASNAATFQCLTPSWMENLVSGLGQTRLLHLGTSRYRKQCGFIIKKSTYTFYWQCLGNLSSQYFSLMPLYRGKNVRSPPVRASAKRQIIDWVKSARTVI